MIYDRELLAKLDGLRANQWHGEVFRHMFGDYPPERENQRGARWNPPETPAIYTSLTRDVALAEADFQISLQPVRPRARRTIYRIRVTLSSVIDVSEMAGRPARATGRIKHDGWLTPSGRAPVLVRNRVVRRGDSPGDVATSIRAT